MIYYNRVNFFGSESRVWFVIRRRHAGSITRHIIYYNHGVENQHSGIVSNILACENKPRCSARGSIGSETLTRGRIADTNHPLLFDTTYLSVAG